MQGSKDFNEKDDTLTSFTDMLRRRYVYHHECKTKKKNLFSCHTDDGRRICRNLSVKLKSFVFFFKIYEEIRI